jgi:hypothetical protein
MVRAILGGRKTQTRRVLKPQPSPQTVRDHGAWPDSFAQVYGPYGVPGDRLWVRETWVSSYQNGCWGTAFRADMSFVQGKRAHPKGPHFHAKELGPHVRWRPSIFMPRWASRITLEITGVRVQRLQDISEEDAQAEGSEWYGVADLRPDGELREGPSVAYRAGFHDLWDSINEKRGFGWDANPWVWAITFKRVSA